jgi:hypothetical protein
MNYPQIKGYSGHTIPQSGDWTQTLKSLIEMDLQVGLSRPRRGQAKPILAIGIGPITKSIVLTELWIFRQSASGACFYRKSILLACLPMTEFILY